MAVQRDNPYSAFNFEVEISNIEPIGFEEVTGLGVEVGVIEYRNGSDKESTLRKIPGLKKFPNVVLKRGIVGDLRLWEWLDQNGDGGIDRRTVFITLRDESGEDVLSWRLRSSAGRC